MNEPWIEVAGGEPDFADLELPAVRTSRYFIQVTAMNTRIGSVGLLAAIVCFFSAAPLARGQGNETVEEKFVAMLKNATLKGTWAPVSAGKLGGEKGNDSYRIARAEKGKDGKWAVVSVFKLGDREIEFPIQCEVKFAGDTAVLILDNVKTGQGSANWSARVMFFDDVYTGRWWETANKEHGGTIAGTITRAEK